MPAWDQAVDAICKRKITKERTGTGKRHDSIFFFQNQIKNFLQVFDIFNIAGLDIIFIQNVFPQSIRIPASGKVSVIRKPIKSTANPAAINIFPADRIDNIFSIFP